MRLNGKHALITGASRGIGRGIALKLASEGAKVAIHYYRNRAAADETLEGVRARGSDGFVLQADVLQADQMQGALNAVKQSFGSLDIFVSNARPEVPEFFYGPMDITPTQWDAAFTSQGKAFLLAV